MRYVFGNYTLDAERYELREAGRLVPVEPRVFDLLAYLVQHPGRTMLTEELLTQLYPNEFAPVERLTSAVAQARRVLHDTAQTQHSIQTIRRRGYRWCVPVTPQPPEGADLPAPAAPDLLAAEQALIHGQAVASPRPLPRDPLPMPPSEASTAGAPPGAGPGMPQAERRQLTVLVCRLVGVAERVVPLGPEELYEVAEDYDRLGAEVVRRFDGSLVPQDQGDRLVVYFGYPHAHEDDAQRAVHTGLGLVEALAARNSHGTSDRGMRLAVRVGIHTGVVVMGVRGRAAREVVALGNTSAMADQVQGLAAPETVVISPTTLRLVERSFAVQALGTYIFEDPAEPLAVYQILHEKTTQSRWEGMGPQGLTPLVGRAQELHLLRERWARVQEGWGQGVLLSGEAGIGKSRLVQALKEHLIGEAHTRIECHALPYYQQSAFYPIVEHVQRLLQWRPDETPEAKLRKLEAVLEAYNFALEEVVPLFAGLLSLPLAERYAPLALPPERQKQQTLEALLTWLLREAERQPVCLVMEDLHWVDPSTLEWLSLLIDQIPTTRVLLLLTFRPDFQPPWVVRSPLIHLTLDRLSPRQTEGMIGQVVGNKPLPAEVMQHVVATTDGVPLFVEELTKMVVELGLVKEREGRYELTGPLPSLAIPVTLHDSLMARLDRLGPAKQVAQLGAVVGREFAYDVLQAVAPIEEALLQQGLARLVEAELLYQRGLPLQAQYRFKHALIQEAAYHSMLRSTRRHQHRRIAQVLEARWPDTCAHHPELVAHHYTEAGLSVHAIPYWQQAGQHALQRSAHPEAVQHLTTGLALLATLPETSARAQQELGLQLALGSALGATKGPVALEVEQAYARARALCAHVGETPQLFPALRGLWWFYINQGALLTARELGEQLVRLAQREATPTPRQIAHGALGATLLFLGDYAAARTHLEQSLALIDLATQRAQALYYGESPGVRCLAQAALMLWCLGFPARAVQRSQEALTLAQALAHPHSLVVAQHFAALLHHHRREVPMVQTQAEALVTLATGQGFPHWVGYGLCWWGWTLVVQGEGAVGLAQLRQGMTAVLATGQTLSQPLCLVLLAEGAGHAGQGEEGLRLLAQALAVLEASRRGDLLAEVYRLQGALLLRQATPDATQAETCFQQALAIARRQQAKSWELRAAMSLSRLWQHQGKRVEAYELLAPIYSWFTEGFETTDLHEAKALLEELGE